MNELLQKAREIALGVWTQRWLVLVLGAVLAVLGSVVVTFVPERFEARASVYVDTQTVLKPLMQDIAVQPDIDQQVAMLAKTLISRPNVERLLQSPGLNNEQLTPKQFDLEVDRLMTAIKLDLTGGKNLYAISYKDVKPNRAKAIVQELVNLFVQAGQNDKQRDSQEARRFIDEQIQVLEVKLSESESRLKDFKLRNFGMTGTSNQDYFSKVSELTDEISKTRLSLSSAEQSRDALKRELSSEDPQLPPDASPSAMAGPTELDIRLDAQKRQLDELLRRYTDEHPDVVSTRRTIAQLERQKKSEADLARATPGRTGAATSPVYQKIRVSLAEAEAQVASLRAQINGQQARLDETRSKAGKLPVVEAELAQLNRDYDVLRKNYEQLVSRRESAAIGVSLDKSQQLADFRIVEPPRVSPKPAFPSRVVLGLLMLLLPTVMSIAIVAVFAQLSPSFYSAADLMEAVGRPVLGTVSAFVGTHEQRQQRKQVIYFAGLCVACFAVQFAWLGWLIVRSNRA
jgi:polysaccharide chain length determinant protein (PEP-CTERM system associated)